MKNQTRTNTETNEENKQLPQQIEVTTDKAMDEDKKKKKMTQHMMRTYSLQILKEHADCLLDQENN